MPEQFLSGGGLDLGHVVTAVDPHHQWVEITVSTDVDVLTQYIGVDDARAIRAWLDLVIPPGRSGPRQQSELPESLRDPQKVLERGRELLANDGPVVSLGTSIPEQILFMAAWRSQWLQDRMHGAARMAGSVLGTLRSAEDAAGVLRDNLALANKNARAFQRERNAIIQEMRAKYSPREIANMVGLTRQRVHQILNEAPLPKLCGHPREPVSICGRHLECPDCGVVVERQSPSEP